MRTLKSIKRTRKIIAITFAIILCVIIAGIYFTNKTAASIPNCYRCGGTSNMELSNTTDTAHYYTCSVHPDVTMSQGHEGGNHGNNGKCTVCNHTYQTHGASSTVSKYTNLGNGTHQVYYTCMYSGCSSTIAGGISNHSGGTHSNSGKCTKCNTTYQTHTMSTSGYKSNGNGSHTRQLSCSYSGCTATSSAESGSCTGGTHSNSGKCTTCGGKYQTHGASSTVSKATDNGNGTHQIYYTCMYSGCSSTVAGGTENHTGGTHSNSGKCTKCSAKYQTHGASSTVSKYTDRGNGTHQIHYACMYSGCSSTVEGAIENHSGATHANGGKCTKCNTTYETHEQVIKGYRTVGNSGAHATIYGCSLESCTYSKEGGQEQCSGGNHGNSGKCTKCNTTYQTHGASSTVSKYTDNGNGTHQAYYACMYSACDIEIAGGIENHTGATHTNGGKCTKCTTKYQDHTMETSGYTSNGNGSHTRILACTYSGCNETASAEQSACTGGTHDNGGICSQCKEQYQNHEMIINSYSIVVDYADENNNIQPAHAPFYECAVCGLDVSYEGDAEPCEGATHANGGKCTICERVVETHEQVIERYRVVGGGGAHAVIYGCSLESCTYSQEGATEQCSGGNHGNSGKCTTCENQYQTHGASSTISKATDQGNGMHQIYYACMYSGCDIEVAGGIENHGGASHATGGKCEKCGYLMEEGHEQVIKGYRTVGNSGAHATIYGCALETCTYSKEGGQEQCSGATHNNGGKCTKCETQYQTHGASSTVALGQCRDRGDGSHQMYYLCLVSDCDSLCEGGISQHTGGTHDNDGECTACLAKYQTHSKSNNASYSSTQSGHTIVYACTLEGCNATYEGESGNHSGGSHNNGGKCSVCGYKYQSHEKGDEATYTNTDTTHRVDYNCKVDGCTYIYEGTEETHTGATHENDGKCTVCSYKYQEHGKTDEIETTYTTTETGHRQDFKCQFDGCTYKYEGTEEAHTGATHENDGKCTVCSYKYQSHEKGDEVTYTTTDTKHRPDYNCKVDGCTYIYEGTEEAHTGATHENDGKCTVCSYRYQEHGKSEESTFNTNASGHRQDFRCKFAGCSYKYEGTEEAHNGGTHSNDGKCTVCSYKYQTHGQSTSVSKYETTGTTHTPVYVCTASGCTETYKGSAANHSGGNHANDGKCTICSYQYQTHKKSTTVVKYETTETTHTPIYSCEFEGCSSTYEGTPENHSVTTWTDNGNGTHSGTCTGCNETITEEHNYINGNCGECDAEEPTEECQHSYTRKNNDKQHWEECTKCNQVKSGSLENHTYGEYTDNGNGTHSATCTVCNHNVTEEHTYENGVCKDCDAEEPIEECAHTYEVKSNADNHWEECSKCNEVKPNSLATHTYGNYINNENGTHSAICTGCNHNITEEHTYEDGECTKCGAIQLQEECEHTYEIKQDETNHWEECSRCNQIKPDSLKTHQFEGYTDNGDGTHTAICSECEYQLTEEHDENCEECEKQGEEPTPGEDGGNDGKEDPKDNTILDDILPDTGVSGVIAVAILVLGVGLGINAFKARKYKDI